MLLKLTNICKVEISQRNRALAIGNCIEAKHLELIRKTGEKVNKRAQCTQNFVFYQAGL